MPGTPKGYRYGGRKPNTPNKVTQSIRVLLNTILPPKELEKHWRFYLKHRDIEIRFAAFKLAIPAVKVRRLALATTSGSGRDADTAAVPASAVAPLRFGSLRSVPRQPNPQENEQHRENSRS